MFLRYQLTDFEKLLWAESYVKELKALLKKAEIYNGVLLSEIDELEYELEKIKK